MSESVHNRAGQCPGCGDVEGAWEWVSIITEVALEGDEDALATLPDVIAHALDVQERERAS